MAGLPERKENNGMKTIKIIEIIGYGVCAFVMWWAGLRSLIGKPFEFASENYNGAMIAFGILAIIIALVLSYATFKNWREYRNGNFEWQHKKGKQTLPFFL